MSKYTTELRFICEQLAGKSESSGYQGITEIISLAREKIFDFTYPIFDEEYKPALESKILKYYYTREIGSESFGLWKLRLDQKMNEIMPYYNQLYLATFDKFGVDNPFNDVDVKYDRSEQETGAQNRNVTSDKVRTNNDKENRVTTGNNTSEYTDNAGTKTLDKYSETPQGILTNLEAGTYLTNARMLENGGANTGNANNDSIAYENVGRDNTRTDNENSVDVKSITSTKKYLEHVFGKRNMTNYPKLLNELRTTFINVDKMVIDDLNVLFFGLWE